MTVVVSDTSPLNYLIQIKLESLLPELYGRIFVPLEVLREIENLRTPMIVRAWLSRLPEWIVMREVIVDSDPVLGELDPGERHAIQLSEDEHADLLLMDERFGVSVARARGLIVTGTLGVLVQAAKRGLVDFDSALQELQATSFRCTPRLIEEMKQIKRKTYPTWRV